MLRERRSSRSTWRASGIRLPAAIFVVDAKKEAIAVREAKPVSP